MLTPASCVVLGSLYVLWRLDHARIPEPRKALLGIVTVFTWPLAYLLLG
jgi:hypothetical protein